MTSALVCISGLGSAAQLVSDLGSAGVQVLGVVRACNKLVHEVVRVAPDIVIFDYSPPGETLFKATQSLADTAARPVLVFTGDGDADHIVRATQSGIHAYVVNGYGARRLRALIQLAQARFRHEQAMRDAVLDVTSRLEDRKMVERAKGILMRARQVSDDEAFQLLRTVSMHTNQRLGQVSQHIIHLAHFADAVNRAGQLRMLSQRLVKLHLLQRAGAWAVSCREQFDASVQRIDANLALLTKNLSQSTYGDLLAQVVHTWSQLKHALQDSSHASASGPTAPHYQQVDALAELLLRGAERLTGSLEGAGAAAPLQVLNVAGRQRMLSQRFAKQALMGMLGDLSLAQRSETGMTETKAAFEQALIYLNGLPLSTPTIRSALDTAGVGWLQMLAAAGDARSVSGPARLARLESLAQASEALLDVFEQLSAQYEHSMQMLVGG